MEDDEEVSASLRVTTIVDDEVRDAIADGRPVVALESTIIAHGLPWPQNVEVALECESIVRDGGAVPATVAVLSGLPRVGLSSGEIERLGREEGVEKVSRRDLATVIARGLTGATTVAATMLLAERAGIHVFVTGGIGGVHRGAERTMDISADLEELARTPVAVVCAGAKSILDLGLTLEYLETRGVPVIGLECDEFPAFYLRGSGHAVDARLTVEETARAMHAHWSLGILGGLVVANPIPAEHAPDAAFLHGVIERAIREAEDRGIRGNDTTPFLLARIAELSDGRSLEANLALVRHNAARGAELAAAYSAITCGGARD